VCGKKIGPDPRNFNQRVSLGRNDLLIRTFLNDQSNIPDRVIFRAPAGSTNHVFAINNS
ncbi:fimbria/pilus outer membrane usher protein, partial [Klebsiella pneumoniae]